MLREVSLHVICVSLLIVVQLRRADEQLNASSSREERLASERGK